MSLTTGANRMTSFLTQTSVTKIFIPDALAKDVGEKFAAFIMNGSKRMLAQKHRTNT